MTQNLLTHFSQDFDENELAHALVDAAIEEDHVVYPDPDPDTGEY